MPQQIPMLEQTEHTLANIDKLVTSSTTTNQKTTASVNGVSENDFLATESGSGEIS